MGVGLRGAILGVGGPCFVALLLAATGCGNQGLGGTKTPPVALPNSPWGVQSGDILIQYSLRDYQSDTASVLVEFATDGLTFRPATEGTGGDGTTGLDTSPWGVTHWFAWDSAADYPGAYSSSVVIRITPRDGNAGSPIMTSAFTVDNRPPSSPPSASVTTPVGTQTGTVLVDYTLADAESSLASIAVRYSTDGGFTYNLATQGGGGDGTAALATSPAGTAHTFAWDSATDVPGVLSTTVRIRITPSDTAVGTAATTFNFAVDNRSGVPPTATVTTPPSTQWGTVLVRYGLSDPNSDVASVAVSFSTNGGPYSPATQGFGGDGTTGLATSPGGTAHTFAWDSATDVAVSSSVRIRIAPSDAAVGTAGTTFTFSVDNSLGTPPVVTLPAPSGMQRGTVSVSYWLADAQSHIASITVEFSTDGGTTYSAVTPGGGGDGSTGLTTSTFGTPHTFAWDSATDLPGIQSTTVRLRITPRDSQVGASASPSSFTVDNRPNAPPTATVTTPSGVQSGTVLLSYRLTDVESDSASIAVYFSTNGGGTYNPATQGVGGDGTTGLATSPAGTTHTFAWDSATDVPGVLANSVRVRITPSDALLGYSGATSSFTVDNRPNTPPTATLTTPSAMQRGTVAVGYTLADWQSHVASIAVEFSTDGGTTFGAATPGVVGDGTTGLSTSVVGTFHTFAWDSATDLPGIQSATVRIRITPSDTQVGSPASTSNFTVDNRPNAPPTVAVTTPTGLQSGTVLVSYQLTDPESDTASIAVLFSTNGGGSYNPATAGAGGDGTTGLATSPAGTAHTFAWDSATDVAGVLSSSVRIRITPSDALVGYAGTTSSFTVDNRPNTPPTATLSTPSTMQRGTVAIGYSLTDTQSHTASIVVEFSTDGGTTYNPATPGVGGDGTTGLATSTFGYPHTFAWDSATDIAGTQSTTARFRITPSDADVGTPSATGSFTVDNRANLPPTATITTPFGTQVGTVLVSYRLTDPQSDVASIAVSFSTDGGATFNPATQAAGGDGTTGLATSPSGTLHAFAWDSATDVAGIRSTTVRIRITPSDAALGYAGSTSNFTVDNRPNTPPTATVTTPTGFQRGPVTISYTLTDTQSHFATIGVEFSTDGGATYGPATQGTGGDGMAGLVTSTTGTAHTFVWNSSADVPGIRSTTVRVRITPSDAQAGAPAATANFTVDNRPNLPPTATATTPAGVQTGTVLVSYVLWDAESDAATIAVEFSTDGGATYAAATQGIGGDGTAGLSTAPGGVPHTFAWDSTTDVPGLATSARIRVTPSDGAAGTPGSTGIFTVDNRTNFPPTVAPTTPATVQSGTVLIGYTLADAESDPASIAVAFSIDGGATYAAATQGVGGDGTAGLSTSPAGQAHVFAWDSATDVPGVLVMTVRLRFTPSDAAAGTPAVTGSFAVNNAGSAYASDDVSGDGIPDLVMAAPEGGPATEGRVYVFFGGSPTSRAAGTANVIITGESALDQFGASVATGDVDGDGTGDLIAGAPGYSGNRGRVYVFLGGPALATGGAAAADIIITGDAAGDRLGTVAAGDVGGDATWDLILGAPTSAASGGAGSVYVFFGSPGLTSQAASAANVVLTGETSGDTFGVALAVGDVDGDLAPDLLAGAPASGGAGPGAGRLYVFSGGAGLVSKGAALADFTFDGEAAGDAFATAMAVGDVDGDGAGDIVVGGPQNDTAGADAGRLYIFDGGAGLVSRGAATADVRLDGETAGGRLGSAVAVGNANSAGPRDILAGAPRTGFGGVDSGTAYIILGSATLISGNVFPRSSAYFDGGSGDRQGTAVSFRNVGNGAADDGIIGAPFANATLSDSGRARVDLDPYGTINVNITGDAANNHLGAALAP